MYKLLLIVMMMAVWMAVHLMGVEEEMAMKTLSQSKRAVNRAAHAAAQQLDKTALGGGELRIDPEAALEAASLYLGANLLVDASGIPLENSFLREPVELLVFDVINGDESFPYVYRNDDFDFEAVLRKPGVVIIAKVTYPRAFEVLAPIEWEIRGAAELVAG
ncbi:hypothetical protein RB620_25760 [Paenibacillus sp. LHD-117]|uniref:hypothetical protein n=1 Tax=Paenibacillus sp. LHD-117 TaxID=3071412 RepID=UPI0027E0AEAA|nr:hypothetical protein [Paenibacillus sp. LHD-117]MDQ6422838.1 hypothetical protein [Paenibacillus sp. LHD-117]